MTLEYKTTSQLEAAIAEAREKEKAAKAGLMVNNQRMYTDDVHAERVKTIETERRQAVGAVTTEVQRRVQEIGEQLLPADTDPLTTLAADDLAKASALAPFVKEDIERGDFTPKLRAVLKSGDKPTRAVWLRYLNVPGERGVSRWSGEVQQMVTQLEAIVQPADPRQGELQARQASLNSILMGEASTNYLQRTYGKQPT